MLYFVLFVLICTIFVTAIKYLNKASIKSLKGRHVVITGGSSGIGQAVAILAAQQGAHVSILSRNQDKLDTAAKKIEEHSKIEQKISKESVDVSNKKQVERAILKLEETVGPIYMLVNCAGQAICGRVETFSEAEIQQLISVNLIGTIYPIQAVLSKFKTRREGIIVLTGSAVSLMGMYGYSIYSACKFALRGLAESIYMEAKPYNIQVTLAVPPDTDTPGFEEENKSKPKETRLMSESGGLYSPETVAKHLLEDALSGNFFSYVGFESFILTTLCVGMSPFKSLSDVLCQFIFLGPLRLIAAFYVKHFEGITTKCFSETVLDSKND
ncbi:3-ketodihydrosphingosine reductase [Anthonomus grandis grandis]|uniref:3-ketodihydrosphingosine reductase n=1 Tax=Anthonomus grandis grandis TaxID=2921223 RepID=UPI0021665CAC|nr:3-ketodihydrosphingosine reductase [Anthonomus grandis grandis]